ncbi:DUF2478 domain-containing protein [Nitrogeniibacter aestuarii]|uniref:DUF2478 domain-containing protein n=1 Tax=Nitrogeniibacter aestuarii TaxID=2815343 RepID=UPI001D105C6D|nr:DUF2478 domain-containing protein [Nitrogeniibacter aestuarii]
MEAMPIAAVIYPADYNPSPLLADFAQELKAAGVRLVGAVQYDNGPMETCGIEFEVLPTGQRMGLSQDLGAGSNACRLDPNAMADAAALIKQGISAGAQLAIFNKFGAQEAGGDGLRAEMIDAVVAGIPLLTAVPERFTAEWNEFTGGESASLAMTADALRQWWQALNA